MFIFGRAGCERVRLFSFLFQDESTVPDYAYNAGNLMDERSRNARWAMMLIAVPAWFGLGLQFYLTLNQSFANGKTVAGAVVFYFSFFTILTNLLVALGTTFPVLGPRSRAGSFFNQPAVQTAITIYIAVVGVVYSLVLRQLWAPTGLQKLADVVLHDLIPLLYIAFWIFYVRKNGLRWLHAIWWLGYPLVYLIYTLIRGSATGTYPYPFLDASAIGYHRMMANAAGLIVVFLGVGLAIVAISRRRGLPATTSS